jgi:hypothetical protein
MTERTLLASDAGTGAAGTLDEARVGRSPGACSSCTRAGC